MQACEQRQALHWLWHHFSLGLLSKFELWSQPEAVQLSTIERLMDRGGMFLS